MNLKSRRLLTYEWDTKGGDHRVIIADRGHRRHFIADPNAHGSITRPLACNPGLIAPLNSGIAAVDHKLRSGHERRFIGGEKQYHVGDFFGCAGPLHRGHRGDRIELILGQDVCHWRFDHPWMHRIDTDAIGGIVHRADLAQDADGALSTVISGGAGGAYYSVNRRDVDDRAATAFAHRWNRSFHPEPHAFLLAMEREFQ